MNWLKEYIDYKGLSVLGFEKSIDTRSTIDKAIKSNSNLRGNILAKIIETYPDLNPKWLVTGKGEMLIKYKQNNVFSDELDVLNILRYLLHNDSELIKNKSFREYIRIKAKFLGIENAIKENDIDLEKLKQEARDKYRNKD